MKALKLSLLLMTAAAILLATVSAGAENDTAEEWTNRGIEYHKNGEWEKAVDACKKALEIDPDYKRAHNNLGWYYTELGKYDKAIYRYKKAWKAAQKAMKKAIEEEEEE